MTDFRELCAELLDELDFQTSHHELNDLKARARAALAEPEPVNHWKEALIDALVVDFLLNEENSNDPKRAIHDLINWNMKLAREPLLAEGAGVEVTDEELLSLAAKCLGYSSISYGDQHLDTDGPELIAFARAVLALAEGAGVGPTYRDVLALRDELDDQGHGTVDLVRFAQEILARYGTHPRPIAMAERLPTKADCDAEGRCWMLGNVEHDWRLIHIDNPGVPKLKYCFSHWLPAAAIPLPQQENNDG